MCSSAGSTDDFAPFTSTAPFHRIAFEVRQRFRHRCFGGLATPFYLAHQHGALYRRDAKVSHTLGVGLPGKASFRFLSDKKRCELVLDNLEDQAKVLAN